VVLSRGLGRSYGGVPTPRLVKVSVASSGTRPRGGSDTTSGFAELWMMCQRPVHAGMAVGPVIVADLTVPS
jgi:hypothetical protein